MNRALRSIVLTLAIAVATSIAAGCTPGGGGATTPPAASGAPSSGAPASGAPASAAPASSPAGSGTTYWSLAGVRAGGWLSRDSPGRYNRPSHRARIGTWRRRRRGLEHLAFNGAAGTGRCGHDGEVPSDRPPARVRDAGTAGRLAQLVRALA